MDQFNIIEIIGKRDFGHVELSIEQEDGITYSYSFGRYGNTYGFMDMMGDGIFIIDNYGKSARENAARHDGRNIIRYELAVNEEEYSCIMRNIAQLISHGEYLYQSSGDNPSEWATRYKIDDYNLITNNCTTMTLNLLLNSCRNETLNKLKYIVSPLHLAYALEGLFSDGSSLITNRYYYENKKWHLVK